MKIKMLKTIAGDKGAVLKAGKEVEQTPATARYLVGLGAAKIVEEKAK